MDDGCSPNDEVDWWRVYAYKGDIVSISFSGTLPNPDWLCFWGDGWEGDYSIHDAGGGQIASLSLSDDNPTGTLSKTMNTADWVYVKIKGKDSRSRRIFTGAARVAGIVTGNGVWNVQYET